MNIPACTGTYIEEVIASLTDLYTDVENATHAFVSRYGIVCPPGCGSCCEHFIPDITHSEAAYIAAYLLFELKDEEMIERVYRHSGAGCPLYRADTPFHCSVYPARPLICRLYASSAYHDKYGKALFRSCKYEETNTMPKHLSFDEQVVTMQDFAYRLRSLDRDRGRLSLLSELLPELLEQIQFIAALVPAQDGPEEPLAG
ncbi:MAG TPA: YkgJ family cysteine cluster protein [Sphaerochaeta sp.]|jgi:Fe-S-cluster containining protein|nr:YkgJ family cysteine cluster protein [Sphaerochaeta sp.]HQB05883.1 YkgJ family cysteine cluster protein [Sphaerochaeta sp.]